MSNFLKKSLEFADLIESKREAVLDILLRYETRRTAEDELVRTLETLRGLEGELSKVSKSIDGLVVSTFFPLNLPLYSLVLFAIAPSVFAKQVYVRTPDIMAQVLNDLSLELNLGGYFNNIDIRQYTRSDFIHSCVKMSDVIIFTGRYENAMEIQRQNQQALFIYNGSGINPIVIGDSANIDQAVDKTYEMRTFNSGQDCAGPDCVFVSESRIDEFIEKLKRKIIADVKVGTYGNKDTTIGRIMRREYVAKLKEVFATQDERDIVLWGKIDEESCIVEPTIIRKSLAKHVGEFHEFFAPVFYVLTFEDWADVESTLARYDKQNMYISYFGEQDWAPAQCKATLLKNKIVNDIERGNDAYGGFGGESNFVMWRGTKHVRPILISREIDVFFGRKVSLGSSLKVTMLGSGCWEGTPAPFCRCRICRNASHKLMSIENRTRPSFYVESKRTKFIIEMSPDLRIQSTKFNLPKIRDYIISHWHFDHLFGLFELHAWAELVLKSPINIYCSASTADYIRENIGFIPTNLHVVRAFHPFMVGNIEVTPIPVYHMKHIDEGRKPGDLDNVFGYIVKYEGRKITYLADYYRVPEESMRLIEDSDAVIADGTYLFEEDWPHRPYQNATREEDDKDHLHGKDILDFTKRFSGSVYYHSINHLPGKTHNELQRMMPERHYVGHDGANIL